MVTHAAEIQRSNIEGPAAIVSRSEAGWRWLWREVDDRLALALAQRCGLPEAVGRMLAARGVGLDTVETFLQPSLKTQLPDPSILKDMDKAAARLARAVQSGEKIGILGDYDVDGATSSALLDRALRALGVETFIYIPDRMREGYGPNDSAMRWFAEAGASLVVTLDCGTVAHGPIATAVSLGLETIVIDHHIGEMALPPAIAVVNPNRFDESDEATNLCGHMAAVGVTFLTLVALMRTLRQSGWFTTREEPSPMHWLDLVALGTICDVVALKGINRAFVSQGLKVMARRGNAGLTALMEVAKLDEPPGTYHAGFVIGPRINAGGRVGESGMGSRILREECPVATRDMAAALDSYNAERRAIEMGVLEQAIEQVERGGHNQPVIWAAGEGWHPGVIGIVAGRLKERYHRPVVVVALEGGLGKASARSIHGVDMGSAVNAARASGLLLAGGGHAMAAGFTAEEAMLPDLHRFLCDRLGAAVAAQEAIPSRMIDAMVPVTALRWPLVEAIERLGPFGMGNPEPRLVLKDVKAIHAEPLKGGEHWRLTLVDNSLGADSKWRLRAMLFRAEEAGLQDLMTRIIGRPILIAGKCRRNRWQGTDRIDFTIEDIALEASSH